MSFHARRLWGWIRGGGKFQVRIRIFRALNAVFAFGFASIPALEQFGKIGKHFPIFGEQINWLWIYAPGLLIVAVVNHLTSGAGVREWERYHIERSGALAGDIRELIKHVGGAPDTEMGVVLGGLLQGMVDTVRTLTASPDDVKFTTALLRVRGRGRGSKKLLCVCARNRLHSSRPPSEIALSDLGPAATAFRDRCRVVVPDTAQSPAAKAFEGKPYKSVVAFPILAAGVGPECAVVTIDANRANTFTDELLSGGLEEAISPYLNLLALSLLDPNGRGTP